MKASTQYSDLVGTTASDITDRTKHHRLSDLADIFGLDKERFEPIGISIYGTEDFSISFLYIDNKKSAEDKPYIVKIHIESENEITLDKLFKGFHVVMYERFVGVDLTVLDFDEEITHELPSK